MAAGMSFANLVTTLLTGSPSMDLNHSHYPRPLPDSSREHNTQATLQQHLDFVQQELESPLNRTNLLRASERLTREIRAYCVSSSTKTTLSLITGNINPSQATTGEFLCLEVGGSTVRCALVNLQHIPDTDKKTTLEVLETQAWSITEDVKSLEGGEFFGWIARNVSSWIGSLQDTKKKNWRLCLTWSFPFRQTTINQASIIPCGKGFRVFDDLVGCDIGTLLVEAFRREDVNASFETIVNDTVSGLLRGRLDDPDMRISVVLGTGLNAAISLPTAALDPSGSNHQKADHIAINTELSLLGSNIIQRNQWDNALIQNLPAGVCAQPLEYMCSGYYIGEMVRIIFVSTICSFPSWTDRVPATLYVPYSLASSLVSILVQDTTADLSMSAAALSEALGWSARESAPWLEALRCIALSVTCRASGIMAMSIFALLLVAYGDEPRDERERVVGVSGAVFEKLASFKESCEEVLNDLVQGIDEESSCTLRLISGGSLTGCALAVEPHQATAN